MIFIYKKDNIIQVLNSGEASFFNNQLLADGWIHTSTFDLCIFLQYLHDNLNNEKEIINQIKQL